MKKRVADFVRMRRPNALVVGTLMAALWSCGVSLDSRFESELVQLATPGWRGLRGHVLTYLLSLDGDAAYFAPRLNVGFTEPVYRYDYLSRRLDELNQGAIEELRDWRVPNPAGTVGFQVRFEAKCRTDVQEGIRVQAQSFCIEPQGRNVVAAQRSPSANYWFVLSAEGEHYVVPENILGFGPSKPTLLAYGQHYLQIVSVADQDFVGSALPVGFETASRSFQIDWIDDGHIVIASTIYVRDEYRLAVVHVDDIIRRR